MGTKVVTRDELELYDMMKNMSYAMFIMSASVIGMGKCGMRSVWREKSKVGKRMIKKSAIATTIIALFGVMIMHQGHHMHRIVKQYRKEDPEEEREEWRRSEDRFPEFLSANDACAFADADSCDAASACTWCKSAAVKSSCKDINDAKALPASIFSCDKLQDVEEIVEPVHSVEELDMFMQPNAVCSYADADSCDADDACTWCKSAAVKSACKDINDAKALPASIFSCDKIQAIDFFLQPNAACAYADADSCDADDGCSWCKSAAVKSACKDINDAKALPASIFSCDKIQAIDFFLQTSAACAYSDADSCDADDDCSWCKSAAVKSSCKDINDAKSLPASIFSCDKISEEVEPVKTNELLPWMVNYSNDACTYSDDSSCDAASDCTWCNSAAVKSRCYDMADA